MIEAVIFDMDGVLVDSKEPHLESWRQLARETGLEISDAQFVETFGRTSRDIIGMLFGVTDTDRVAGMDERKESIYRELVRASVPEMTGARSLVAWLVERGVRCAVGSSGPRENVALVCDAMGFDRLMSATVCGADVQNGKPDPQVFLIAAERLGVGPANCVVIEDAPAGIEAARRAGMRSIGLSSTHDAAALVAADATVERLGDIEKVLENWGFR